MKKRVIYTLLGILSLCLIIGCSTKTDQTKVAVPAPQATPQEEEFKSIPDAGDAWEAVKIQVVETAQGGKTTEYTVKIGGDYIAITNTKMKLKVDQFVPDFFMSGQKRVGSKSKELNNPAVQIVVTEEGKAEPFTGWIFSRYPDIHKGPSEKHSFRLVDFVKKQ
ncbi:hypothetical protein HZA55_09565 [Candidatus Poribacteria bacterium]|nr:hypothetical protein [Candidatus Poribacteria bacterium]